jgi:hypothetical protein
MLMCAFLFVDATGDAPCYYFCMRCERMQQSDSSIPFASSLNARWLTESDHRRER